MTTHHTQESLAYLEALTGGPLTFGRLLRAIRQGEAQTLAQFAHLLGVSKQNLSDIEHERRGVSLERAAAWARVLGYDEGQFVELAIQAQVRAAGLPFVVKLEASTDPPEPVAPDPRRAIRKRAA